MKYCSHCAGLIIRKIPENDHLERDVCSNCHHVFYKNPLVVSSCIVESGNSILLCRRNIDPGNGFWTIPGGFLENKETTEEAAIRETNEEAMAEVAIGSLHGIYNIPRASQLYFVYRGTLVGDQFAPTPESREVALFREEDIPWDEIAFTVVKVALQYYFLHQQNNPHIHIQDIR